MPPAWLVLLSFGAMLALFVAVSAEVALRIPDLRLSAGSDPRCAGSDAAQLTQKGLYRLDPAAGYVMRSNLCVRLRTDEYDEVLRTNTRGMVGPEVPSTKPPGEFRIVVLGDSFTVGGQVPYEQTFPAVLEQALHDRGYSNVRVINTGVGGYTTFNESGLLREDLDWLQPDLVVVAAYLGNDVGENVLATDAGYTDDPEHPKGFSFGPAASDLVQQSLAWFPRNGQPGGKVPGPWEPGQPLPAPVAPSGPAVSRLAVGPIPAWVFDASPVTTFKNAGHWLWDTARTDSRLLGDLFGQPPNPSISTEPGKRPPSKDQRKLNVSSFEWTILRERPHTYWLDVAWPLFGAYLGDIHTTAASAGAGVVLMAIPEIAQVEPAERARTMAEYRFTEDEVNWDRPQTELRARAEQAGFTVVDLLPGFRASPERDALYLPNDQHFTAVGHRAAAAELAAAIVAGGWLH
ncbi:MAG TPA: GDSL-type esterase/lipase family protein [Chloroflexota bacterium]|nr:GDSL-type esterase/lipase family protein [Chloroflexota bacterium]